MKPTIGKIKIFLIAYLTIQTLDISGQNHLSFKGYTIAGDMKSLVSKMKADGFRTIQRKNWFKGMRTKYLEGDYWRFPKCQIAIRQPKKYNEVTSIYIHPRNNYLLLEDLISTLDSKYGKHEEIISTIDINDRILTWNLQEGCIQIFARTIYGQSFDIIYRDYVEVNMLNHIVTQIDNDL